MKKATTRLFAATLFLGALLGAQTPATPPSGTATNHTAGAGTVRGTLKDDTGGIIPGASVTLTDAAGQARTASTQADGAYVFHGLPAGTYSVTAAYSGLQQKGTLTVTVAPGKPANGDIVMTLREEKQEVTVTETGPNQVTTDPANNASALVLKQEDLDSLPDDPDDLQADLQALAGPSAGPGGSQIYIDGFTGGQLPPKSSIREIRINSNPFSAEFDKLGFGRIQIFTKPGTDKFHGQSYYDISDGIWNSRNPFLTTSPPFRTQLFGGNVSGPISKKASFFFDVERRQIDDNGIATAVIPTANLLGSQNFQTYYSTPQRRTTFSPRVDYQINANNTLSIRYNYLNNNLLLTHLSAFNLGGLTLNGVDYGSNGNTQSTTDHTVQIVETAVLSPTVINESHFEFERTEENTRSLSNTPQLNITNSFVVGGSGETAAGYPNNYDLDNYYEFQNYSTVTKGAHTIKFGIRVRTSQDNNFSPVNFNGEYAFLGLNLPVLGANGKPTGATQTISSIQQYLTTEQLLASGMSPASVTAMGYGPSKFTINTGNPYIGVSQTDFGPFLQDDWRARPNLTLSVGVRYEAQTNISDYGDFAPRFGFAWAPAGGSPTGLRRPKTVIRGGWGYFYDRFALTNVLQAERYGLNGDQQTYTINNPTVYNAAFTTVPSLSELTNGNAKQYYEIDPNLKAPRVMQTVVGIDRQLFSRTSISFNFINSRGTHELLTDDINAPYPVDGETLTQFSPRPYGNNIGDLYDYQSVGIFKQTQAMVMVNSTVGKRFMLFGRYSYNQAHSDTDGGTPANPYDIAADYGRSQLDVHNQLFIGGSISVPWGLRLSPFIVAHSGTPFNVITGTDIYQTGAIQPTARPELVDSSFPGAIFSPLGYLNPNPALNAPEIARNALTGPGYIGFNLRLSKTFGFGTTKFEGPSGGARAGGGGGHGGGRFGGPGEGTLHRYNLTASVNARNILNHENLNTPNGDITSQLFLRSTNITGGFGAEATASDQRRIDLQLRFTF